VVGELFLADRFVNLVEEGIDVAVRIGVLSDSSLVARAVGATRRVLVASPAYLEAHGTPRSPDALAERRGGVPRHRIVHFTSLTPTHEWRFFRGDDVTQVTVTPTFATNSAEVAVAHAEAGRGLALVLAYQAIEAVRAGRLVVVLARHEPPPFPIQLVYPTSRLLSSKVRAFVDHVTKTCRWHFVDV
jgi:DNA-binding transcriptional LysR family regulator